MEGDILRGDIGVFLADVFSRTPKAIGANTVPWRITGRMENKREAAPTGLELRLDRCIPPQGPHLGNSDGRESP